MEGLINYGLYVLLFLMLGGIVKYAINAIEQNTLRTLANKYGFTVQGQTATGTYRQLPIKLYIKEVRGTRGSRSNIYFVQVFFTTKMPQDLRLEKKYFLPCMRELKGQVVELEDIVAKNALQAQGANAHEVNDFLETPGVLAAIIHFTERKGNRWLMNRRLTAEYVTASYGSPFMFKIAQYEALLNECADVVQGIQDSLEEAR